MNRAIVKRLEKLAEIERQKDAKPSIKTIEVYCGDVLLEIIHLGNASQEPRQ